MRDALVETVGVTSTGPVRGAPRHAGQADRPPFPRTKAYMRDDGPLVPPETLHGGPTWGLNPADPPHLSLNTLWAVSTGRSVHGPGPRACRLHPPQAPRSGRPTTLPLS